MGKEILCECGGKIEIVAEIVAPGFGLSGECKKCGKEYWVHSGIATEWKDVELGDNELTAADVI